ncbi:MAG: hypothetical protein ACKN81_12615, partial [Pirellulaceae bacterium]
WLPSEACFSQRRIPPLFPEAESIEGVPGTWETEAAFQFLPWISRHHGEARRIYLTDWVKII